MLMKIEQALMYQYVDQPRDTMHDKRSPHHPVTSLFAVALHAFRGAARVPGVF